MSQPLLLSNLSRSGQIHQLTQGYGQLALDRVVAGWEPYLLVLKYRHIGGRHRTMIARMHRDAERAYAQILTRVWRHPRALSVRDLRPVWVLIPDVPVSKREKVSLLDLLPNDGVHLQGVAVMPPGSRLREGLDVHLAAAGDRYCPSDSALVSLYATPIVPGDVPYVHRYNFKALPRGRVDEDNVLVLPASSSEMDRRRPHRATEPWRPLVRAAG